MATRPPTVLLTAKEERVVLNLLQQGKSNLATINHYSTQEMELTLEQVLGTPRVLFAVFVSSALHCDSAVF